jgi:hypothetical protein
MRARFLARLSSRTALFLLALALGTPPSAVRGEVSGDISGDGKVTVADAVAERNLLATPAPPLVVNDCNRDGTADAADMQFIIGRALAKKPSFSLAVNQRDGALLLVTSADGEDVEFFGRKDADGKATVVDALVVHRLDGQSVLIELDAAGRARSMIAPDGTRFELRWISDTSVQASVATPDGLHAAASAAIVAPPTAGRSGQAAATQGVATQGAETPATAPVALTVSRCGRPAGDAWTSLTVTPSDGGIPYLIAGRATGVGGYAFDVPTSPSSIGEAVQGACEATAGVLDTACTAVSFFPAGTEFNLCGLLGVASATTTATARSTATTSTTATRRRHAPRPTARTASTTTVTAPPTART